jgi:chromosome partitioning protein
MIITLYSTKSSTKTSIAVSTSVYLMNKGKDVVFADLDIAQASASEWLDYREANEKLGRIPCIQKSGKYVARELIELKKRNYDYVIADCAGHHDVNGRSALTVTDLAIVPVLPSSLSLITLENTLNSCINAQAVNPNLKVIVVLTGCHSNHLVKDTQEAREAILDLIKDEDNFKLANTTITARKVWNDIVVEGKGITESNNTQSVAEFNQFMEEIFNGSC